MTQPYPDELTWWSQFTVEVNAIYLEASAPLDDGRFLWFTRTAYDIGAGMDREVAKQTHLRELRQSLNLPFEPSPRLHAEGDQLVRADGQPFVWKGCSDFLLYHRFLLEESIEPLLQERVAAGANLVRVLGMCEKIEHFWPQDHTDFYRGLELFVPLLADRGLYVEFVVFADAQLVMPSLAARQTHFTKIIEALRPHDTAIVELVNEYPKNGVNPAGFARPSGLLCSAGSGLADASPAMPLWDFFGWHGRRDWPKVTSSTEDMWYYSHGAHEQHICPAVHDEPMGFAEEPIYQKRSNDPKLARQIGASCAVLGAGGTFHSEAGLRSEPFGPVQRKCAEAFFAALV